jgi:hypothetical protein
MVGAAFITMAESNGVWRRRQIAMPFFWFYWRESAPFVSKISRLGLAAGV